MDLSNPSALDYLPAGIARKPLYQFLGPLVDYALTPSDGVDATVVDPLVRRLILDYQDSEAVNAYLNLLVRPVLGTRRSMDYAFKLLNIAPALVEWWQPALQSPYDAVAPTGQSDKPYHFTVTFPDGTLPKGPFDYHELIQMLLALKNERSRLVSVRMADCVDMITLDNDCNLDMYWLDSLEGFVDPETGVTICLHEDFTQRANNAEHVALSLLTVHRTENTHAFPTGLLDFTIFGEDATVDQGTFVTSESRTSRVVQRSTYAVRNMNFTTGEYTVPQGRTTNYTAVGGGPDVATHTDLSRTADRGQAKTLNLVPTPHQTIPARLMTQQVPREAFYRQRAWTDQPDGRLAVWADPSFTWLSDQPQGYSTHTQQDVSGWVLGNAILLFGKSATTTASVSSGQTLQLPTAWLSAGMAVSGTNIPAGATVVTILDSGTLTISAPVSGTVASGASLNFATPKMPGPVAAGTLFYGTKVTGAVSLGRPAAAALGKAPPAGSAAVTLALPVDAAVGKVGVAASAAPRLPRPALAGVGMMVPVGNGLVAFALPAVDAEATTTPQI